MRGHQKAATREWSLFATALSVIVVGSASSGYLLLQIVRAWGWISW